MREWYESLTPGQRMLLGAAGWLVIGVVSTVANQAIGARRGYRKGYADGLGPLKQVELDAAKKQGYHKGWVEGVWAYSPEVYSSGIKAGAELVNEANRNAIDVVNQARFGSVAFERQQPQTA